MRVATRAGAPTFPSSSNSRTWTSELVGRASIPTPSRLNLPSMPLRRADLLIAPLNDHRWAIRVDGTVHGEFDGYEAASREALQLGRLLAAKGVEVRILVPTISGPPKVVWSSDWSEPFGSGYFESPPSKDARVKSKKPRERE